ncbi:copper resistance protein B [Alteraurantiacibacter aquimixticola]|uniref:Copper resistance protein B n=1 Tax=Alteraurantiacibacter aquimixticola TaxID=2489173 RepID=A0A4T3F431_9SPHN|nr:copper resistance protein B [Alteraurantiacibacter aquimixticola]TIX50268.1 copper resistance protein B [Alteraurantiacibacter aquimixticola]
MRYLAALPLLASAQMIAMPLVAQDHDHATMDHSAHQQQEPVEEEQDHSAMDHGQMDHSAMGHSMPAPSANAAPPPRAFEGPLHAADAIWGEAAMQPAREQLAYENGGMRTGSLMVERLEARLGDEDAVLWDLQGFWGGDVNRFVFKSEGEGELDLGHVEDAEVQALWSHAIGPFFDLQAGARLDLEPETRSHLVLGLQGLAPYMWHVDAAAFLSDRGDLTARVEAEYDQKITQSLILQPRVEIEASAQDIPERDIGAGLTSLAAGLRLRYEIAREFAPYVGVEWEGRLGQTRDIARANGEDPSATSVLVGLRAWF